MSVAARSDPGRAREENQDRYLVKKGRGVMLLAVADGVGGEAGGAVAARAAVDALAGAAVFGTSDPAGALSSAMRVANDAVLRAAQESGNATAASTLVAAAVHGRSCAIANLGDSRAYLVRGGSAAQITDDHAGARDHSITRFVGDPRGVAPDVFTETLRPRDRLVLCSDGLVRHVPAEEIARVVSSRSPESAAAALVELANARGGEDNVTVVVYESPAGPRGTVLGVLAVVVIALFAAAAYAIGTAPAAPSPSPSPSPSASPSPSPSAPASPSASPTAPPSPSATP